MGSVTDDAKTSSGNWVCKRERYKKTNNVGKMNSL